MVGPAVRAVGLEVALAFERGEAEAEGELMALTLALAWGVEAALWGCFLRLSLPRFTIGSAG